MGRSVKGPAWGQVLLAMAGIVCVTVLAVLRDIGGEVALVAIVAILGAGGVHTALSLATTAAGTAYHAPRRPAPPSSRQDG